jgi:glycosyltransferase involved in cell wall biosynthesis
MRILLITDLYPLKDSNEPNVLKDFAKAWQQMGHIVDVIRPNFLLNTKIRKKKIFPSKTYFEDNIKIMNVNYFTPLLFDITKKLPKDFQKGNYNLIISHMPTGALFAMKLLEKCGGIPYIAGVHASDITVLTKPLYKFFFKKKLLKAYKRADAISARSQVLMEKIKQLSPFAEFKTFVAPSGIDKNIIEPFEFFDKKSQDNSIPFIITTTAKLIKRKNIDIVLKALANSHIENYLYRIIGDGEELENLKNLAKSLKIDDKVVFTGQISHKEVLENLTKSNLFVLVSENETFGMSYLEAAARANIVIATKNDGIDGLIQNGINGFTCEPDEFKLANLIDEIYNMPKEKIREMLLIRRTELIENDDISLGKQYLERAEQKYK